MNEEALKVRIRTIAKEKEIHPQECWKMLFLERFLTRLSCSVYSDKLIFKGGFLLSYIIELGRETRDLDFSLRRMNASEEGVKEAMENICAIKLDDGFLYKYAGQEELKHSHGYSGCRVNLHVNLGGMKERIELDISVGDAVHPMAREFSLFKYRGKPVFENEISLMVYPVETIFAEKFEAVISKGGTNTRMKDYHDLFLLTRSPNVINVQKLKESIKHTFQYRETRLQLIKFSLNELILLGNLWSKHLRDLEDLAERMGMPRDIENVINEVNLFVKDLI